MAKTLTFRGQALGDGEVKIESDTRPATPLAILTGLFAENAQVSSESRNLLYALIVTIFMKKADEVLFAQRVVEIQELAGLSGQMLIKDGATTKIRWNDCILAEVPRAEVQDGFGGRWTPQWQVTFVGSSRPEFL